MVVELALSMAVKSVDQMVVLMDDKSVVKTAEKMDE